MMGFGPTEARQLTYWEFTAMLTVWNERHRDPSAMDESEMPDFETMKSGLIAMSANDTVN